MAEIVIRRGHLQGYSVVENRHLRRLDLSGGARGVLAYLWSLPDGWVISRDELRARFPLDSRRAFCGYLRELRALGYLRLAPILRAGAGRGRFSGRRLVFCPDVSEPRHRKRVPSHLEPIEQFTYDEDEPETR